MTRLPDITVNVLKYFSFQKLMKRSGVSEGQERRKG